MNKFHARIAAVSIFVAASNLLVAQQTFIDHKVPVYGPVVVNFSQLAKWEATHPVTLVHHEQEAENAVAPPNQYSPILQGSKVTNITLPNNNLAVPPSPTPLQNFTGLTDDGFIPPDVQAAAGPVYLDEHINTQFRISTKTGSTVATVSDNTFWSALSSKGTSAGDPRIQYDPNNQRWITVDISIKSSYGLFIAVSQTSDPTGNWNEYQFDAGSGSNIPDFPSLGFNANWAVVTDDYFANGFSWNKEQVWVMNLQDLYNGTLGTVHEFDDAAHIQVICPAQTYDASQLTEYLLQDYNGNSGGSGFVRMTSITGTPDAPVYNGTGVQIGINQPWSETVKDPFQKGSTKTINSDDVRMSGVLYRNGFLWGAHSVYLPVNSPNHCSSDIWQIDPSNNTVHQFFRIDDPTNNTNYFYACVAVNSNNDALIGYTLSGNNDFPSAAYSFRAGTDPLNTLQSNFTYKAGLASYFKDFGTGRNRWGDFSETTVDPADQSFWTCQEWAQTGNNWATQYANVAAASGGCTDIYEPNNTKNTAAPIAVNTPIHALINPSGDVDFFSFSNTASQPNIDVQLTNLPADYNLTLFSPSGTQVGTSKHSGTQNEEIKFNTTVVGTYKVKVNGKNGAFNATNCYTLEAAISTNPFRLTEADQAMDVNTISNIYPNPVNSMMKIDYTSSDDEDITLFIRDLSGRVMQQVPVSVTGGSNILQVQVNHLPAGLYVLEVRNSAGSLYKNFMVQQ